MVFSSTLGKNNKTFLRGSEFLWQEGHTIHASEEEARKETLQMLEIYRSTAQDLLAIPMVTGRKTESENLLELKKLIQLKL